MDSQIKSTKVHAETDFVIRFLSSWNMGSHSYVVDILPIHIMRFASSFIMNVDKQVLGLSAC